MKDNIIPFPGTVFYQQELEDVTVLQCPEKTCEGTQFFLELKDDHRIICASCFATFKEGW